MLSYCGGFDPHPPSNNAGSQAQGVTSPDIRVLLPFTSDLHLWWFTRADVTTRQAELICWIVLLRPDCQVRISRDVFIGVHGQFEPSSANFFGEKPFDFCIFLIGIVFSEIESEGISYVCYLPWYVFPYIASACLPTVYCVHVDRRGSLLYENLLEPVRSRLFPCASVIPPIHRRDAVVTRIPPYFIFQGEAIHIVNAVSFPEFSIRFDFRF